MILIMNIKYKIFGPEKYLTYVNNILIIFLLWKCIIIIYE